MIEVVAAKTAVVGAALSAIAAAIVKAASFDINCFFFID